MNTATTTTATPEPSAPVFDYHKAERTILDRAEFARLIRKHHGVTVYVFVSDCQRDDVVRGCAPTLFLVEVPAKQALEKLARGDFDAHAWGLTRYSLEISHVVAPAWLQMRRRCELLAREIAETGKWLADHPLIAGEHEGRTNFRRAQEQRLIAGRTEVARWNAQLDARHQQPVAA